MADGFLGRWSQRKQADRQGKPLQEPAPPVSASSTAPASTTVSAKSTVAAQEATLGAANPSGSPAGQPPALSLQDAAALGAESDYAPFVARSVSPEVRNAAMKKLFTDPHYNLMDRLDTYIDDYSLPDPLPESMLRQMASAKFLNLFDDAPQDPAQQTVAQSPHTEIAPVAAPDAAPAPAGLPPEPEDDHSDMRLQPNHAAGREPSGRGTQ